MTVPPHGRAAAKGLQPRTAARHGVTTKLWEINFFFRVAASATQSKRQIATPLIPGHYVSRQSGRCVRNLLITESPKTPSHYRYQIQVLGYIPYTGLAVFSLRFLVFLCILRFRFLKFVFSTLQSRSCFQLANSCLLRGHEGLLLWIDILSFLLPIGIFSRWFVGCLVRLICSRS